MDPDDVQPGFIDPRNIPSWKFVEWGARSVLEAENDPEKTMLASLTQGEVALVVFSAVYVARRIKELERAAGDLLEKMRELHETQDPFEFDGR